MRHHRRSIRLQDYDYAQNGAYFVTVCTHNRAELFGQIADGEMRLNSLGEIVAECWQQIPDHFPSVALDEFMVMPNHVHGIVVYVGDAGTRACFASQAVSLHTEAFAKPVPGSLPTLIRSFKSAVSKSIHEADTLSDDRIWQRNYYEHVIRSEESLNSIRQYIQTNPAQWENDAENPAKRIKGERP